MPSTAGTSAPPQTTTAASAHRYATLAPNASPTPSHGFPHKSPCQTIPHRIEPLLPPKTSPTLSDTHLQQPHSVLPATVNTMLLQSSLTYSTISPTTHLFPRPKLRQRNMSLSLPFPKLPQHKHPRQFRGCRPLRRPLLLPHFRGCQLQHPLTTHAHSLTGVLPPFSCHIRCHHHGNSRSKESEA